MKNIFILTAFFFLNAFLSLNAQQPQAFPDNGFWQQKGYGSLLEISDKGIVIYDISAVSCIKTDVIPKRAASQLIEFKNVTNSSFTTRMGINEYDYTKLDGKPELCQEISKSKKKDPLYNFESLWHTFNEQYSYFKERNIDWKAIGEEYKSRLTTKTKPLDLYKILDAMLGELNDGHVGIEPSNKIEKKLRKLQIKENNKKKPIRNEEVRFALMKQHTKGFKTYHYGSVNWGMINENLAIIQLNAMAGLANYNLPKDNFGKAIQAFQKQAKASNDYTKDEIDGARYVMDSIFKDIKNAKACIVDLRTNGGGIDEVALEILRYFTNNSVDVFTKKARLLDGYTRKINVSITPNEQTFKGKVYFLTSRQTASAAEIFVLSSIKANPDIIRIGSNTEGIFSDILEKQLPNGWSYGLSNEIYESMEGVNYENIGIEPHHHIDYPKERKAFYQMLLKELEGGDKAIEKVLELENTK